MQRSNARRTSHGNAEGQDVLPDQVLVSVLELIPRHSVLASVAMVNKRWLRVATSQDLWASKMAPVLSQCCTMASASPALSWGKLFFGIYQTNLLANPYFQPPLQQASQPDIPPSSWVVTAQGGSGWAWEPQPIMGEYQPSTGEQQADGQDQIFRILRGPQPDFEELHAPHTPRKIGGLVQIPTPCLPYYGKGGLDTGWAAAAPLPVPGAVASSYRWCELTQVVDLVQELTRRGLSSEGAATFLDACPPLSFSVWYASRVDCPAECEAKILLTDEACSYTPTRVHEAGPAVAGEHVSSPNLDTTPAARLWSWTTGCVQPQQGSWHCAKCVLAGYPPGVRQAVVVLRGRDRRYWAGHYGAKLAAPTLHFLAPDELVAAEE